MLSLASMSDCTRLPRSEFLSKLLGTQKHDCYKKKQFGMTSDTLIQICQRAAKSLRGFCYRVPTDMVGANFFAISDKLNI